MKRKYLISVLLISLLLTAGKVIAETVETADQSADYSDMFQSALLETNEIATQTRLNVDDMPAFVTILYRDDLLNNGINTVFDALSLVPSVQLFTEASGINQVIFRGVKEKGKVKLLVDGVDINNIYRGSVFCYYSFPIELIKRIEVIRGPGSEVYGSGAMSGVINIVTLNSDHLSTSKVFGSIDTYGQYRTGMLYSQSLDAWHIGVDGYYAKGNKGLDVGPDKGGTYGQTDEASQDYSAGMSAENDHVKLTLRLKRGQNGIAFGGAYYLPDPQDTKGLINKSLVSEAAYNNSFSAGVDYSVKAGYTTYNQEVESRMQPTSYGNLMSTANYKEDRMFAEGTIKISRYTEHILTGGIRFDNDRERYDTFHMYLDTDPDTSLTPSSTTIEPDGSRQLTSFYLSDQYAYNSSIDFSTGLRWEIDSDADNPLSARLGMVYRANEKLSYKALYSHAYRIPSWIELYLAVPGPFSGKNDLSSEKSDTIEFGTIYTTGLKSRLGGNVYCTRIHDLIVFDHETVSYQQGGKNRYLGTELTWRYDFSENTDIDSNLSYMYAVDSEGDQLPDIAHWLANVTLSHTFLNGLISTTRLRLVSKCKRAEGDTRSDLSGYTIVDESLSYRYKKVQFIASLKNLFDADVRYPAPPDTYINDYPRNGRFALFMISWEL